MATKTVVKRFVGNKIPTFGTPVAIIVSKNVEDRDTATKKLIFEFHLFIDGITTYYDGYKWELDYANAETEHAALYFEVTNKISEDEIVKILCEALDANGVPRHLFQGFNLAESEHWEQILYSLWLSGSYDEKINYIAERSESDALRTEFTKTRNLPKMTLRVFGRS